MYGPRDSCYWLWDFYWRQCGWHLRPPFSRPGGEWFIEAGLITDTWLLAKHGPPQQRTIWSRFYRRALKGGRSKVKPHLRLVALSPICNEQVIQARHFI